MRSKRMKKRSPKYKRSASPRRKTRKSKRSYRKKRTLPEEQMRGGKTVSFVARGKRVTFRVKRRRRRS
jgi:hypothetical protein